MHEIIQEDRSMFLFLNNLGSHSFDQFWIMISATWIWIPLYIIFLYLLFKNYQLRNLVFILIFIALGVTFSDQLAGIFKTGVARLRPCHDPTLTGLMRDVKCGGQFGFYSSHAANTFFIATFMSLLLYRKYRLLPYILFIWAIIVSYSRIYLGVHFPLDILMGSLMGFFAGGFFATLALKVIHKQNNSNSTTTISE
ncbi:phosphatase PAP2 family protein [Kaistella flava (ex Peng et al. 2021)]|uniref:Phosphatase PAP2 family protein n=1 Tax=Kaistella flava (ex Peng et al. 2021) TaxID=2038776 RepID=A0A7M2Y7I1_9FLAO|nr:phosphatase PAP2 family protein [Kaistella flava (ex Peng et al. 2021)]QOW10218.1 phosphatase PAP2 family protein [Kaistella flava (ex Peng et al. 2021)]